MFYRHSFLLCKNPDSAFLFSSFLPFFFVQMPSLGCIWRLTPVILKKKKVSHQYAACFTNDTLAWWSMLRLLFRQAGCTAVLHWPVFSLPEASRAVFGNTRGEGRDTDAWGGGVCWNFRLGWLMLYVWRDRMFLLLWEPWSLCFFQKQSAACSLGSLSAWANVHNSMWLGVLKQQKSCQASLLICFLHPLSLSDRVVLWAVQTQEAGRSWSWVHPRFVFSRWVSLGKSLCFSLCLTIWL